MKVPVNTEWGILGIIHCDSVTSQVGWLNLKLLESVFLLRAALWPRSWLSFHVTAITSNPLWTTGPSLLHNGHRDLQGFTKLLWSVMYAVMFSKTHPGETRRCVLVPIENCKELQLQSRTASWINKRTERERDVQMEWKCQGERETQRRFIPFLKIHGALVFPFNGSVRAL